MAKLTKEQRRAKAKARTNRQAKADPTSTKSESYLKLPDGIKRFEVKEAGTEIFDVISFEANYNSSHFGEDADIVQAGDDVYGRIYGRHVIDKKYYACPQSIDKPCPFCEEEEKLKKDWDNTKEERKVLRAQVRFLYNTWQDEQASVYDASAYKFETPLREELKADEANEDFQFLDKGKSLVIRYAEDTYNGKKFFEPKRFDFEDREDLDESVLDEIADLNEVLVFKSYEDLEKILHTIGEDVEEDYVEEDEVEEVEEVVEKTTKAEKKSSKAKKEVEEKVEEEPESDAGDAEETEEDDW